MAAANLQAAPADADPGASAGRHVDATGEATASLTPELVIALCGPIGSPLHSAAEQIANALSEYGYRTEKVRMSEFIRLNAKDGEIDSTSEFSKIKSLIRVGDELRHTYDHDILAKLAIAKIGADRQKTFGKFKDIASEANAAQGTQIREHRICHVIDSIKNSSELDLLRLVYGDALFAIGIFSPLEVRQRNLEKPGAGYSGPT